jgi:hypothetical protein
VPTRPPPPQSQAAARLLSLCFRADALAGLHASYPSNAAYASSTHTASPPRAPPHAALNTEGEGGGDAGGAPARGQLHTGRGPTSSCGLPSSHGLPDCIGLPTIATTSSCDGQPSYNGQLSFDGRPGYDGWPGRNGQSGYNSPPTCGAAAALRTRAVAHARSGALVAARLADQAARAAADWEQVRRAVKTP